LERVENFLAALMGARRAKNMGCKVLLFQVQEPRKVPLYKRTLFAETIRNEFWPQCLPLAKSCGCYIFAVPKKRGQAGYLPIYVGRATKTFEQECFTSDKLNKINHFLLDHRSENVFLILLLHPRGRGRTNERAIEELEANLIRFAVDVNPNLINKRGVKPENWGIHGVLRGGRGRTSKGGLILKEMLQLGMEGGAKASATRPANAEMGGGEPVASIQDEESGLSDELCGAPEGQTLETLQP
jgi:hypothetical protein